MKRQCSVARNLLTAARAFHGTCTRFVRSAQSLSATAVTSVDVDGSWRVGIGRRRPAIERRISYSKDRRRLAHGDRKAALVNVRYNRRDADSRTAHGFHAIIAAARRTSMATIMSADGGAGSDGHLQRHIARLDDRQAHSHSDEHREKECDKLSCRPAFHDAAMLALKYAENKSF